MSIIQKEFIRRILEDEAHRLEKNQGLAMKKQLHFRTGNLFNDRVFDVQPQGAIGGKLTFRHTIYQRFLDIKRKVRSKAGSIRNRSYQIHNRFIFGHYYSIGERVMYEMTDDVVQGIKRDLKITN